jgi:hypothetical protein
MVYSMFMTLILFGFTANAKPTLSFDEPWVRHLYLAQEDVNQFSPTNFVQMIGDHDVVVYEHEYGAANSKHPLHEHRMLLSRFCSGCFKKTPGHGYQVKSSYLGNEKNKLIKLIGPYIENLARVPAQSVEFTLRIAHAPWQFACHFDAADNIFIQLHGKRRVVLLPFEVGIKGIDLYDAQSSIIDTDPTLKAVAREFIIGPGDVLFIPAGWFHYVESVGDDFLVACSTGFELPSKSYVEVNKHFDRYYAQRNKIVKSGKEGHHICIK